MSLTHYSGRKTAKTPVQISQPVFQILEPTQRMFTLLKARTVCSLSVLARMGSLYMVLMMQMENCGNLVMLTSAMVCGLMDNIHMSQLHSTLTLSDASDQVAIALTLSYAQLIQETVDH